MQLGVIDKDQYQQYRYWQTFQKLLLAAATAFTVASMLLSGSETRRLSEIVCAFLWVFFVYAAFVGRNVAKQMQRDLPPSLQSLLLFSSEVSQEFPPAEPPSEAPKS